MNGGRVVSNVCDCADSTCFY